MQDRHFMDNVPAKKEDVRSLPIFQLKERLARQERLLANPGFLARLPDKGAKIVKHVDELRAALQSRHLVDEAARQLEAMCLEVGPAAGVEGAGAAGSGSSGSAESSSASPLPMLVRSERPADRHVEVADRSSTESASPVSKRHSAATNLGEEMDVPSVDQGRDASDAGTSANSTAATGQAGGKRQPLKNLAFVKDRIVASAPMKCKLLSLEESSDLLQEQEKRLKDIEGKQAAERLKAMSGKHDIGSLPAGLPAELSTHRGGGGTTAAGKASSMSAGDVEHRKMMSLRQSFVDAVPTGYGSNDDDDSGDDGRGNVIGADSDQGGDDQD